MDFFNFSNPDLYVSIIFSILNAVVLCYVSYKCLQVLQLSGYKFKGFGLWLRGGTEKRGKYMLRLIALSIISMAFMLVFNTAIISIGLSHYWCYLGLLWYFFVCWLYIKKVFAAPKKTPLKPTHRMSRLIGALAVCSALITFALFYVGLQYIPYLSFSIFAISCALSPFLVCLCHLIMSPFENLNNGRYINNAKKKIQKNYSNIIRIGITGSYGKTSCKYILATILKQKYNVCSSPNSFNTSLGLTSVVNHYLKPKHEVLIAEMGARKKGEIAFLCDIIRPQYAIITPIGPQHIATFSNVETIAKTKNELIKSLPENGFAVFLKDNEKCFELATNCNVDHAVVSATDQSCNAFAKDVCLNENGMSFILCVENEQVHCSSPLLGEHNLQNILQCAALAKKLGLTMQQIANGISQLAVIPHRLQVIRNKDVTIIDNSYNSNPQSSKASLKCLEMFESKNKIVVTPGLVELGDQEETFNEQFGRDLAKVANVVIVVNEANKAAISKGLGDFENVFYAATLDEAKKILKEKITPQSVVLFENDLPDNYT